MKRAVQAAKARALAALRVRRHDQRHRLQRLDQKAADVGAALAQLGDAAFEPPAIEHQRQQAERHRRQRNQRQPPVEPDHHHQAAGEEQHVADPRQRRFRRDALDLADVVVEARDDVAEPRARVEARRQPLQVFVERQPHVEQDLRRHARVAKPADDVEHEAEQAERDEPADDAAQGAEVAADERGVDQVLRQVGNRQRRRGADQADQQHEHQAPPIRNEIGERAAVHRYQLKVES